MILPRDGRRQGGERREPVDPAAAPDDRDVKLELRSGPGAQKFERTGGLEDLADLRLDARAFAGGRTRSSRGRRRIGRGRSSGAATPASAQAFARWRRKIASNSAS